MTFATSGAIEVVQADVFEAELPLGEARLVYADPPYTNVDYFGYGRAPPWPSLVERMLELAAPDAAFALHCGSGNLHEVLPVVEELCPRRRLRSASGNRARVLAWIKPWGAWRPNTTFQYSWEPIIVFYGRGYRHPRCDLSKSSFDWFECAPQRGQYGHPTEKPVRLLVWLFDRLLHDARGRTMVDLFAGTGTAAIVGSAYGLDAIAVERDVRYTPIIARRAAAEMLPRLSTLESQGEQGQFDGVDGAGAAKPGNRGTARPPHYRRRRHLQAKERASREQARADVKRSAG